MADAVQCDVCEKIILNNSNEILQLIHVTRGDNDKDKNEYDFCGIECAHHAFKEEHDVQNPACQVESIEDLYDDTGSEPFDEVASAGPNVTVFEDWCVKRGA